jgi:hypothetical protein
MKSFSTHKINSADPLPMNATTHLACLQESIAVKRLWALERNDHAKSDVKA